MKPRKNWQRARVDAGKTLLDATIAMRDHLPRSQWVGLSKLQRFEAGGSATIDPIALGVLARLYKKNLRDIDPDAAAELDELRAVLDSLTGRRHKYAPRDSNPEPAVIGSAGSTGRESVTSATPAPEHSDSRAA